MAQFPSKEIASCPTTSARWVWAIANIGGLLMNMGFGYDSEKAARMCGA